MIGNATDPGLRRNAKHTAPTGSGAMTSEHSVVASSERVRVTVFGERSVAAVERADHRTD